MLVRFIFIGVLLVAGIRLNRLPLVTQVASRAGKTEAHDEFLSLRGSSEKGTPSDQEVVASQMTISLSDSTIVDLANNLQVNYSLRGVRKTENAYILCVNMHTVC